MAHSDWIDRACPTCASTSFTEEAIASSERPAEDLSFDEVKSFFVGLRQGQVFFSYHRCTFCGLLYCPRYFSEAQLEILYADMPDNLMGEDKATASKTQSGYVNWIEKRIDSISSFLELGPDIGLVSSELQRRFNPGLSILVEPNKSIYPQLLHNMGEVKDLSIFENLEEITINHQSCDLFVGIHVFDHLLNPKSDLQRLKELSRNHAKLVLVVHNEKSILRKLLKAKWPPFCLQHPQLFNPATLGGILKECGWGLERVSKTTNWWHARNLIGTGLGLFGISSSWVRFLPNFEFPTKLGNVIAMATPDSDE